MIAYFKQWCARVIFDESKTSQNHKPFKSGSSQSHPKLFRVESESSHDLVESSQSQYTTNVESLICKLESMSSQIKFHIFSMTFLRYEMVSNMLWNGVQCYFSKFDCRLYISKFFQFAFYLSLSLPVISTSLAKTCCRCCKLSASVVLNAQFTTSGMCVKNNTHIYVVRKSRNRISTTCDLYRHLLPQCEPEMITIRFAGWISGRIVSLQPDTDIQKLL